MSFAFLTPPPKKSFFAMTCTAHKSRSTVFNKFLLKQQSQKAINTIHSTNQHAACI